MSVCRSVSRLDDDELSVLVAFAQGANIQRNANFLETSLGIAWDEEVHLSRQNSAPFSGGAEEVFSRVS
jgi:hypothetical protein